MITLSENRFKRARISEFKVSSTRHAKLQKYLSESIKTGFNHNIIMTGDVGVGKTYSAFCIINELAEFRDGKYPYYVSELVGYRRLSEIIETIKLSWEDVGYKSMINDFNDVHLLIIDECMLKESDDFIRRELFDIIDIRYNKMIPTMVISNLTEDTLRKVLGERIADRLWSNTKVFNLEGGSEALKAEYNE